MNPARPPAAPVAAVVSDASAFAVLGLSPRQFRAFLLAQRVPNGRIGRRTVARLDRILEVIDRLAGDGPRPAWSEAATIELAARGGRR